MLVLGLTGNIGCGKSSVSTIFMNHGIEIVDADIVARHIFEDLDLLNKVFSTFGETIKNEDGSLNRKAIFLFPFLKSNCIWGIVLIAYVKNKLLKRGSQNEIRRKNKNFRNIYY